VPEVSIPVPVLKDPDRQDVQDCALVARQPPWVPAPQGFGHARIIIGEYVSPLKPNKAATSCEVKALW
jgi:hypothetical protein